MESATTYLKSIADHQTTNSTTDEINKILKVQPKTFERSVIDAVVQNTQLKSVLSKKQNVFIATEKDTPFNYVEQKQPMKVETKEYPTANVRSILSKQLMVTKKMKYLIYILSIKDESSHSLSH